MALTLTIADNRNGTGAVATVLGNDQGPPSLVTVRIKKFADREWSGIFTGNPSPGSPTIPLALGRGTYWAYASGLVGAAQAIAAPADFSVSFANDSTHYRCAMAIADGITALNLDGSEGTHLQMLPDENAVKMPCAGVWFNDAEQLNGGTNVKDLIGFPVHVAAFTRKLDGLSEVPTDLFSWRERISDRFRQQRLMGVPESNITEWVPEKVIDEKYPAYLYLVMAMTFVCWCRKARG